MDCCPELEEDPVVKEELEVPDEVANELVRAEPVHKEDLEGIAELEVPLKLPVQEGEDEAPRSIETLPGMPVRSLVRETPSTVIPPQGWAAEDSTSPSIRSLTLAPMPPMTDPPLSFPEANVPEELADTPTDPACEEEEVVAPARLPKSAPVGQATDTAP